MRAGGFFMDVGPRETEDNPMGEEQSGEDMAASNKVTSPLELARRYLQEGRLAEAVDLLRGMVQREPDHALAHQELAVALFKMARRRPAVEAAQRALELDPSLHRPHGILAWVALGRRRYEEAERELQAQLAALPEEDRGHRAAVHNQMGYLFFRQDRHQDAEEALSRALALVPDRPVPRLNLALLHVRMKERDRARSELEQLLTSPELPEEVAYTARFNLGHLYARQGRYAEARGQFAQAVAVHRTTLGTLYHLLPFLARIPVPLLTAIVVIIIVIVWNIFLRR